MKNIKMLEICRNIFLWIFLFLMFTVVEIPYGSSLYLFVYHLFIALNGVIVVFLFKEKISAYRDQTVLWLIFILVLLLFSFSSPSSSLINITILVSSIFSGYLASLVVKNHKNEFCNALDILITLNYSILFIQLISYYAYGQIIDFHTLIFPFSESHSNEIANIGVARITGLHNEPGTYSTWVSSLIFLRLCLDNHVKINHYIGILSILLTFSVSGYFFGLFLLASTIYLNLLLRRSISKSILTLFASAVIVSTVVWYGAFEYLTWRFLNPNVVDGTSIAKLVAIDFLSNSNVTRLVFGSGFSLNDCYLCDSIQDVGLLFNLYFQLGVGSLVVFVLIVLIIKPKNIIDYFYLTMLMLSKMFIFSTAFIAPIYILGSANRKLSNDI